MAVILPCSSKPAPTGRDLRSPCAQPGLCDTREVPVLPRLTPGTPFGVYVHVPFCATRCGYCDFNTYTPAELAAGTATEPAPAQGPGGATPDGWLAALRAELDQAAGLLGPVAVDTVFVGGGTPSLLGAERLAAVLDAVRDRFALADDAEVTAEANPESTSADFFAGLRAAGYTRISLGMQSAVPQVLAALDRAHSPGRAACAAREALAAGFRHVNLDLMYGVPGESDQDVIDSVGAALAAGVDHVSAYALVVEEGTALARRVRRDGIALPADDALARRYRLIDQQLSAAGMRWYEVSNWSRPGGQCRHNIGYWSGGQWWGAGPGAHGFIGDVRWWNVKHPTGYARRVAGGQSAIDGFERLDERSRHVEDVLLGIRLRRGLDTAELSDTELVRAGRAVAGGLLHRDGDRLVLTDRGRLLADGVVRDILDDECAGD